MAYHFVAESEVHAQFGAYAAAVNKADVREAFKAIREDQDRHQMLALRQLEEKVGSKSLARKMIRRVRLTRAYEAWLRFAKGMGDVTSAIVLGGLYYLCAPIFFVPCRRWMAGHDWSIHLQHSDAREASPSQAGAERLAHPLA